MAQNILKPNVFEYSSYKAYIQAWISARPNGGRGVKSKIAEISRVHLAYVSQVLTGNSHFSLEQAESLNSFFEHNEEETHFFLLLVELGRAGSVSLKKYFERQIQKILNERLLLRHRFTDKKTLTSENQATYYSHWAYCAIHMAVLNPRFRTPGEIAHYFDINLKKTIEILDFW